MIGNLPAAESKCIIAISAIETMTLDCNANGQIAAFTDFGVFKDDSVAD